MGKIIGKGASVSVDVIKFLMRGRIKKVPRMEMKCVDVHDVAQAHVRSLLVPEAANQRFIIVHKALWMNEIAEILANHFDGNIQQKLPIPTQEFALWEIWLGSWFDSTAATSYSYWGMQHNFDTSKSKEILGITYSRDPKEYILETAQDYIDSGAVKFKSN